MKLMQICKTQIYLNVDLGELTIEETISNTYSVTELNG